jgi:hypothetical protein
LDGSGSIARELPSNRLYEICKAMDFCFSCECLGRAMRFLNASFSITFALTAIVGCSREQARHPIIPTPSGATNSFVIHLQEGFYQSREAVVTVDGREVYRGTPKTRAVLGFAVGVSVTATSSHPVVTFTMPSKVITWSQKIDLSAGAALGFSLTKAGQVEFLQATGFGYD